MRRCRKALERGGGWNWNVRDGYRFSVSRRWPWPSPFGLGIGFAARFPRVSFRTGRVRRWLGDGCSVLERRVPAVSAGGWSMTPATQTVVTVLNFPYFQKANDNVANKHTTRALPRGFRSQIFSILGTWTRI